MSSMGYFGVRVENERELEAAAQLEAQPDIHAAYATDGMFGYVLVEADTTDSVSNAVDSAFLATHPVGDGEISEDEAADKAIPANRPPDGVLEQPESAHHTTSPEQDATEFAEGDRVLVKSGKGIMERQSGKVDRIDPVRNKVFVRMFNIHISGLVSYAPDQLEHAPRD